LNRPILVVSDAAARLVRRGLLDPTDPTLSRWRETRVVVFAHGPVIYEPQRVGREPEAETCPTPR
jgi:hypothetical protein